MESREFSHNAAESSEEQAAEMLFQKRRCCFSFPYFRSSSNRTTSSVRLSLWHRVTAEIENNRSLWTRGFTALKELRLWSEVVAGPRWKNFIRRFSRTKSQNARHGKYQYDPLSYAMNFDEGPGQNGNFEDEEEHVLRNFSTRYASVPGNPKSPTGLGNDGPSFV